MPTEIEAKFRATGPGPLERLSRIDRLGPADLEPVVRVDEVDRYLDTADGALAAERWACRLRERHGSTVVSLKGPPEAAGVDRWLHRRPEIDGPAGASWDPDSWPSSPARDLVDRLRRGAPLRERFTLRQRRDERRVVIDGHPIGTLSLDTVVVVRQERDHGTFHAVELELDSTSSGRSADLDQMASILAGMDGLAEDPMSKLEHALGLLGER